MLLSFYHGNEVGGGGATPQSVHKSFNAGLGTRLKCRHRFFIRIEKKLKKFTFGE